MSEQSSLDEFNRIVDGQFPSQEDLKQRALQDPEVQNYLQLMSPGDESSGPNLHVEFAQYLAEHHGLSRRDATDIITQYYSDQRAQHG